MDDIRNKIQKIDREIEVWNKELLKKTISFEYHEAEIDNLEYERRLLVEQLEGNDLNKYEQ